MKNKDRSQRSPPEARASPNSRLPTWRNSRGASPRDFGAGHFPGPPIPLNIWGRVCGVSRYWAREFRESSRPGFQGRSIVHSFSGTNRW